MGENTLGTAIGRKDVKQYLQQYGAAARKKRILEERHRVLANELRAPAPGSAYRTIPASPSPGPDGAVSVVFRIAEVEERVGAQVDEMARAVLHVMDLIDLLPVNSIGRTVVELRHIDCKGWERIARETYLSRSAVFKHYNAALDYLLGCRRTEKLVGEFRREREARGE